VTFDSDFNFMTFFEIEYLKMARHRDIHFKLHIDNVDVYTYGKAHMVTY